MNIDKNRLVDTMRTQSQFGDTKGGGLHRLALSDEDKLVRDWFKKEMQEAGLSVRIDEFGNMFGRRTGKEDLPPLLIGSHLDSQPYGGIYDGALGVVGALEFVRELNKRDITTPRPVEIVNWTNEEGSRFSPAMQGSGVWAGAHSLDSEYNKKDKKGNVLRDELERIGYRGSAPAEPPQDYYGYLELHIEQGPYLEAQNKDVGVVTGIVGINWGEITFYGEANHSGATPMQHRSDALVAASDVITQIRRIPSSLGERTVGTTGFVDVEPNSINIIPSEVTFTWGFRDPDDTVLEEAADRTLREAEAAANREGIDWEYDQRMDASSVHFSDKCVDVIQSAANQLGYDSAQIFSGGGHDATHAARVCDTGMVFAVSENGKSHTEKEHTSWEDCHKAANTLATAALQLANKPD